MRDLRELPDLGSPATRYGGTKWEPYMYTSS